MPEDLLAEIALVRHAQSKANTREVLPQQHGDHAIELTEEGERQAVDTGVGLREFMAKGDILVYRSPYVRTRQTTSRILIGANSESLPIYEDPRLREVEHGYGSVEDYERQQELRVKYGWFYYRFDGGESPADCYDRVTGFVESLWRQAERKKAKRALIVSHGLTIRCLVMRFLHLSVEDFDRMANPKNASVTLLRCSTNEDDHKGAVFRRGRWSVHGIELRKESRASEAAAEPKKHCFHHDGVGIQRGWTMEWGETCCQCGEKRSMVSGSERTPGHGPHVSVTKSTSVVATHPKSEHCTPAPVTPAHPFTGHLTGGADGSGVGNVILGGSSS